MSRHLLLGVWITPNGGIPLTYKGEAHMVVVAPPRKGKSLRIGTANLVRYGGSMVVLDLKGEFAKRTALWRKIGMGQKVIVFDPFKIVDPRFLPEFEGETCYGSFNPVDFVRNAMAPLSAAFKIAEAICPVESQTEPHWSLSAQGRIAATLYFVAFDPVLDELGWPRNMGSFWKLLSDPQTEKLGLKLMAASDASFVADQAVAFTEASDDNREMQGIRNHIRTVCTRTFGEPAILNTMLTSNVDFSRIGKEPTTVYIVMPGDMAVTHNKYMRILIATILSEIERGGLRDYGAEQPPTVFLLDEFYSLGNFKIVLEAMGRMAGYGITFLTCLQSFSQAKGIYGDEWLTILGNAGIVVTFGGTNCILTAETLSKLSGTVTVPGMVVNDNLQPGQSQSVSHSTFGRPLYFHDDIMRLNLPRMLIMQTGENPCEAQLFDPSLGAFTDYLAFQIAIEGGGTIPEAIAFMEKTERERAAKESRQRPLNRPRTKKGWLNKLFG